MKERKLRFNFIDVIIILLIAAIVFALLYIFVFSEKKDVVEDTKETTITYVIQGTKIDERFDGIVKAGDYVENSVNHKALGTVVGVQSEPYQVISFNSEEDKEVVAQVEGKISVNLTIESKAEESDKAFSIDGCDIRVGQKYSLALPGMNLSGYCIAISSESDN